MVAQVTLPADGTNPYAWFLVIALGAIGYVFKLYNDGSTKRTDRCEKREDLILADNRAQAETIKEQSATLVRVAALAEDSFTMAQTTADKIDDNRKVIEQLRADLRRKQQGRSNDE